MRIDAIFRSEKKFRRTKSTSFIEVPVGGEADQIRDGQGRRHRLVVDRLSSIYGRCATPRQLTASSRHTLSGGRRPPATCWSPTPRAIVSPAPS